MKMRLNRSAMAGVAAGFALLLLTPSLARAEPMSVKGAVSDVFGHRVVVTGDTGKMLVHLGKRGSETVKLKAGDQVTIDGDLRPNGEVRAARVTVGTAAAIDLPGQRSWWDRLTKSAGGRKPAVLPADAKAAAVKAGYEVLGEPIAEKRHLALLGKKDGKFFELHARRDGSIASMRTVEASDKKWGTLVK